MRNLSMLCRNKLGRGQAAAKVKFHSPQAYLTALRERGSSICCP